MSRVIKSFFFLLLFFVVSGDVLLCFKWVRSRTKKGLSPVLHLYLKTSMDIILVGVIYLKCG